MERYEKCNVQLGEGGTARVQLYRGAYEYLAVKKVFMCDKKSYGVGEVHVLQVVPPHRNIVHFHEAVEENDNMYVVLEFLPSDLKRHLHERSKMHRRFEEHEALSVIHDILCGLQHLHNSAIAHRDIKPANVLLGYDRERGLVAKISDFGHAKPFVPMVEGEASVVRPVTGTAGYIAPEVLFGCTEPVLCHSLDMWGCGCVFGELLTMKPLFDRDSTLKTLRSIFKLLGAPTAMSWASLTNRPELYPHHILSFDALLSSDVPPLAESLSLQHMRPQTIDLLAQMLTLDPFQRIDATKALCHPAFAEVCVWPHLQPPAASHHVQRAMSAGMLPCMSGGRLGVREVNVPLTPPPSCDPDATPPRRLFDT
eukprot:PhF_6_TR8442/c0_g1_i1/m.13165/K02090/CDK5; cyclin-dependent kinase 5